MGGGRCWEEGGTLKGYRVMGRGSGICTATEMRMCTAEKSDARSELKRYPAHRRPSFHRNTHPARLDHRSSSTRYQPPTNQPTTDSNNQTRARRPASGLRLRDVYNCEYTYIRTSNMYNVIKERKEKERRRERGRERSHMYDYVYDGNDRNDTMRGIHGFTSRQR